MKKIIILAIAISSTTGIVLSNSLKKSEVAAKPASVELQKDAQQNTKANTTSYALVAQGD